MPKRKPFEASPQVAKPPKLPSKFVSFGARDSRAIETAFQKLSEEEDAVDLQSSSYSRHMEGGDLGSGDLGTMGAGSKKVGVQESIEVPVNEDYLFDVDIRKRELAPVYWLGPAYDIRRGTWFFQGTYYQNFQGYLRTRLTSPLSLLQRVALFAPATKISRPKSKKATSVLSPSAPTTKHAPRPLTRSPPNLPNGSWKTSPLQR